MPLRGTSQITDEIQACKFTRSIGYSQDVLNVNVFCWQTGENISKSKIQSWRKLLFTHWSNYSNYSDDVGWRDTTIVTEFFIVVGRMRYFTRGIIRLKIWNAYAFMTYTPYDEASRGCTDIITWRRQRFHASHYNTTPEHVNHSARISDFFVFFLCFIDLFMTD